MLNIPDNIADEFRVASSQEVRSWSFGQVKAARDPNAHNWRDMAGSLDDERIFGPQLDYECSCGKYSGVKYKGMICDRCGVKIASHGIRRERFGHIELSGPVQHPLILTERLETLPVLPASYWESTAGAVLVNDYDEVLNAVRVGDVQTVASAVEHLMERLLPIASSALSWNLADAMLLFRGLALVPRSSGG